MRAGSWSGTRRKVSLARAQDGTMVLLAFALVAAGQAVDLDGRPRAALLDKGVAALAEQLGHAQEFAVLRLASSECAPPASRS